MKQEDFEEYIYELQNKKFKTNRRTSTIINNFYTLVTIVIMTITIVIYVNIIVPSHKKQNQLSKKYEKTTTKHICH